MIGAALSDRAPQGFLRTALGIVLIASGYFTLKKGDPTVWPIAAASPQRPGGVLAAPRWLHRRREREGEQEAARAAEARRRTRPAD